MWPLPDGRRFLTEHKKRFEELFEERGRGKNLRSYTVGSFVHTMAFVISQQCKLGPVTKAMAKQFYDHARIRKMGNFSLGAEAPVPRAPRAAVAPPVGSGRQNHHQYHNVMAPLPPPDKDERVMFYGESNSEDSDDSADQDYIPPQGSDDSFSDDTDAPAPATANNNQTRLQEVVQQLKEQLQQQKHQYNNKLRDKSRMIKQLTQNNKDLAKALKEKTAENNQLLKERNTFGYKLQQSRQQFAQEHENRKKLEKKVKSARKCLALGNEL